MSKKKLLTASDVAVVCDVGLKTIHTWVDKGHIVAFRTPGRHIRIEPANLVSFLEAFGYPVPATLREPATPPEAQPPLGSLEDEQAMAVARWRALSDAGRDFARDALTNHSAGERPIGAALALLNAFDPPKGGA